MGQKSSGLKRPFCGYRTHSLRYTNEVKAINNTKKKLEHRTLFRFWSEVIVDTTKKKKKKNSVLVSERRMKLH